MIEIYYSPYCPPYPWTWRVHFPNGTVIYGAGIPNKFATPCEACCKAKDYLRREYKWRPYANNA